MVTGTVKFVSRDGCWGFISRDDKKPKVFVHLSAIERAGVTAIEKGQRWEFELHMDSDDRLHAAKLVLLGSAT